MKTIILFLLILLFAVSLELQEQKRTMQYKIQEQQILIKDLKARLDNADYWINFLESENREETVTATVYNAEVSQCNKDCFTTANGFKLSRSDQYQHRIIAVSRDLLKKFPFGTKVKVTGTAYDGIYTVKDLMNKRFKKTIDILINKGMKIGKWQKIIIKKI